MRRLCLLLSTPFVLAPGLATAQETQQGMPLDHTEYFVQTSPNDPMVRATGLDRAGEADRALATSASRIEIEPKFDFDRKDLPKVIRKLRELAKDDALTERKLGKGWRIRENGEWRTKDTYRDSNDLTNAREGAGFRVRSQGGNMEINVKPAGARKIGRNQATARVENNLTVTSRTSIRRVAETESRFNPLNALSTRDSRPAVHLDQNPRTRFVLEHFEKNAQGKMEWTPLVDLTVDDVTARPADRRRADRQVFKFAQFEADLNHPGSGSGVVISNVRWAPPHRSSDLARSGLEKDPAVRSLDEVTPRLLKHFDVEMRPGGSKYETAVRGLGMIEAYDRDPRTKRRARPTPPKAKERAKNKTRAPARARTSRARR